MDEYKIGSIISFGGYNWRVLDRQKDTALIITEEIVELRAYHDVYKDTTWADCELRKYLNGEFYDKFSETDKSKIISVLNKNPGNPWYGTKGGKDTKDNIFLLSIEDVVCKYFGDSSKKLQNRGKNQKYWFQRKDENNSKRISIFDGYIWWWWLRSPGRVNVKAVYVHGDGNIGIQGNNIFLCNITSVFHPSNGDNRGGVRPALWLKLDL
ncbi:DUF6273 domain-containing protein [Brucepastera parasyntrophica]|uniref:DUF6273 domain-containing protein n=1 Tax=Brucepastera parasyntrophica TaxID=2880008 RepID=UPI00210DC3A6|nr:DUF6273 domain-containing protein [Brucepastera parasyntrophica]ULQ61018.1 DUF6273 domain-containing protein [Brucepastera parasyntrophica]